MIRTTSKAQSQQLEFTKLVACGNDFVAIDNRCGLLSGQEIPFIQAICDRRFGVGADGLLLVENARDDAHFHMRIFNSDGSEAPMCGNGARACALFAESLGFSSQPLRFTTKAGLQEVLRTNSQSRICLNQPTRSEPIDREIQRTPLLLQPAKGLHCRGHIFVGVPHLVIEVEKELETLDLREVAPAIRYHSAFTTHGVNVMFVQRETKGLFMRAWEQGVEGETWGCGTGAVAACLLLRMPHEHGEAVQVRMKGGLMFVEPTQPAFSGEVSICHKGYFPVKGIL